MNIQPKYNLGDTFWIMKDNLPQSFVVMDIFIHVQHRHLGAYTIKTDVLVKYEDNSGTSRVQVDECRFYPTKQDLLNSL